MTKAIFVDGRSLHNMERTLATSFRTNVLFQVLRYEIGFERSIAKAICTLSEKTPPAKVGEITRAGFEVIFARGEDSQDDQVILTKINEVDSSVTEIVIVSNDSDFAHALLEKAKQGISIYWVGTKRSSSSKTRSLTLKLEKYFESKIFNFIDIANFLIKLEPSRRRDRDIKKVAIAFVLKQNSTPEDNQRLQYEITRLLELFPNLRAEVATPYQEIDIAGRRRTLQTQPKGAEEANSIQQTLSLK